MTRSERRDFEAEIAILKRRRAKLDARLRRRGLVAPTVLRRGPAQWGTRTAVHVRDR